MNLIYEKLAASMAAEFENGQAPQYLLRLEGTISNSSLNSCKKSQGENKRDTRKPGHVNV